MAAPHFMYHLKSAPPLPPLLDSVARLERAGITCALGGSGLLGALGLADRVRDWDLTTDEPLERIAPLFEPGDVATFGPWGVHADGKLTLAGGVVEILSGFAFRSVGGVVRIPTVVSARRDGIPLGSPEAWAAAYALLGRREKSEALFGWLAANGADDAVLGRLLTEPLPPDLARRLDALPRSSTSSST